MKSQIVQHQHINTAKAGIAQTQTTMTSREMVDFINNERRETALTAGNDAYAELQHRSFMDKVPSVLGEGCAKFIADLRNEQNGQIYKIYRFPKREACLMAMSYSYALQAKVFDRMSELEAAATTDIDPVKPTAIQPAKEFRALFGIARLIGMDKNAAAISANHGVKALTGTNMLALMEATHLKSETQSLHYTPTELGKRLCISSQAFNRKLADAGLQERVSGHWSPTPRGKQYAVVLDTGKAHDSGTPVQQVKWIDTVLDEVAA